MLPALIGAVMLTLVTPIVAAEKENSPFFKVDALLTLLEVPHQKDRESLIEASQLWRRKPGVERWEVPDLSLLPAKQQQALTLLDSLGMVNKKGPDHKEYNYVLVLGATVPSMERRLQHMVDLWGQGVRYQKVYFLTGQRPLTPDVDKVDALVKRVTGSVNNPAARPVTESEAARMLWFSTPLTGAPADFIESPRKWRNSQWERPNTQDTLSDWLATDPLPGDVLVITEQPHAHYQSAIVRSIIPDTYTVDYTAVAANPNTRLVTYLDALALWLANDSTALQSVK